MLSNNNSMFFFDWLEESNGIKKSVDSDGFTVELELPGYKKDQIEVLLDNKKLSVIAKKGERKREKEFLLGKEAESIEAKLEDGILYLKGKWKESEKAKKIEVSYGAD